VLLPYRRVTLGWGDERSTALSSKSSSAAVTMAIDIRENSFRDIEVIQ
jgi:hypothetical protein